MIRALPLLSLLMLAACAGSSGATTPTVAATTTTTSEAAATTSPSTTIAPTSTTAVEPAAVVADSLAASRPNYRFTSIVLVGEQTVTTMTGVVDGESVSAEIATGTSEVSYVRTPEGEWVTGPDGDWVALEGEPPVGAPLDALSDAGGLTLESGNATRGVFTGVLGPAAASAQGIEFTITVEDGYVSEIRYQVDTGGEQGEVVTTLSDFGSAGAVTKPEGV
jgi:hypothetical protein